MGNPSRLTNDGWLQINEDGSRHMSSLASLGEECLVGVIRHRIRGHHPVGLNAVLQTVEFPAGVAHLDSGLADMD